MDISEDNLKKVMNYGALKYSAADIILLLNFNDLQAAEFTQEINNSESNVYKFYKRGILVGEYNIDASLATEAQKGDIDAISKLEERQILKKYNNLLNEYYGL